MGLLAQSDAEAVGVSIGLLLGFLVFVGLTIAGTWMVNQKAGKPGWAAIVPIYNIVVLLEIIKKPVWWVLLLLIPIVNIVVLIIISMRLATAFGKGTGFGIGLAFLGPIFYPILGFGPAEYHEELVAA